MAGKMANSSNMPQMNPFNNQYLKNSQDIFNQQNLIENLQKHGIPLDNPQLYYRMDSNNFSLN